MSGSDAAASAAAAAQGEQEFDQQLFALGGFAFIALITVIVILFLGVTNVSRGSASFQLSINNSIAEIQALLPPTFAVANSVLNTFENLTTDIYNGLTFAVVEGTQAVLNTILAIGGTIVETIGTSAKILVSSLETIGSEVLVFFQNVFSPIVPMVQQIGDTIILFSALVLSMYSPILSFVAALIRAIERVGSIFT